MSNLLSRIVNRSFYYGISSILGRIVGFIMLPIYTNYLTPTDYGVASFIILYVSLVQTVFGARLQNALSKLHYDDSIKDSLSSICLTSGLITILFCILPVSLGVLLSESISLVLFDTNIYSLAIAIASLNILLATLEIYGLEFIKIKDLYKQYLSLNLLKLFLQLGINIYLVVYMKAGVVGIIASSAVSSLVLTLITFLFVCISSDLKINLSLFKPLIKFSAPLWLSGLVGLYGGSIHQVFIKHYDGLDSLGLYNLASTFGSLVAALLLMPFLSFWQVERFRVHKQENAIELFQKVFYSLMIIALIMSLGIALYSRPIIEIMAHESFHAAATIVAPLTIVNVITHLGWFLNFSFLVTGNTSEIAKNAVVYSLIVTVVYFLTIPNWGYIGAAYGVLAATLINFIVIKHRTKFFYDIRVSSKKVFLGVFTTISIYLAIENANPWISDPIENLVALTLMFIFLFSVILLLAFKYYPSQLSLLLSKVKGKM